MLNGEISEQEYLKKLALLNPKGIKKIIEISSPITEKNSGPT